MRVLVIADHAEQRAARARDVDRAGHEACGLSRRLEVTARVRATRPDVLLIELAVSTSDLRALLMRARGAAEAALSAVVMLEAGSVWLHAALPDDLAPAVGLEASADARDLGRAFDALAAGQAEDGRVGEATVEYRTRRLVGPGGEAWLTPSEAAVFALLAATPGAFVEPEAVARALWGRPIADRHALGAIRSHLYTLRRKLRAAGLLGTVESRTGVGYRMVLGTDAGADGPG